MTEISPFGSPPPMQVMPKSPGAAAVVGFLFPGVGNMMSGHIGKGIAILAATIVSWCLTVVLIGFILVPLMHLLVGPITAYGDARRWNYDHGIIS